MVYKFREFYIPEHMMESLKAYIEIGRPVGHFLEAVLCNNLRGAIERADDVNIANLPAYVGYLYNEAPSVCWGSKELYEAWIEVKQNISREDKRQLSVVESE